MFIRQYPNNFKEYNNDHVVRQLLKLISIINTNKIIKNKKGIHVAGMKAKILLVSLSFM